MRKELIAHRNPKSPNSEIFRTLRTNIQFMNTNKKLKTLLVTSTFPGEGKSWVTSNLAVTFAQAGKKVILIDADMRKGRQYSIFGVSPKPGLSNYLAESEVDENGKSTKNIGDYIQETEIKNLYVISAGNVPPNPSELLVSAQMIKLLDDLKELCDLIIIDGTPCELVADSIILSRIVDSCIIIAAHKMTKKDALERVVKNIQNVGGKLAGIVINRVPTSKGHGSRYYYYGDNKSHEQKNSKFKDLMVSNLFPKTKKDNISIEENIAKLHQEMKEIEKDKKRQEQEEVHQQEQIQPQEHIQEEIQQQEQIQEQTNIVSEKQEINSDTVNVETYKPKAFQNYSVNTEEPVNIKENFNIEEPVINSEESEKSFANKTDEILKQINEYINQEKNNL